MDSLDSPEDYHDVMRYMVERVLVLSEVMWAVKMVSLLMLIEEMPGLEGEGKDEGE